MAMTTLRRFMVAERSMEPTLVEGQGLLAVRSGRAKAGQIRVFEHPRRPDFWLVKRVTEVHDDATMTVLSDNPEVTRADSRSFGRVPIRGSYRVLWAVPRRLR